MNKIALSLVALVALSGAAFAQKTERDDHITSSTTVVETAPAGIVGTDVIVDATDGLSAYERQLLNAKTSTKGNR